MYKRKGYTKGKKLNKVQKKQVKRLITGSQELKAKDDSVNTTADNAGSLTYFNLPAQGDGLSERSGDQIQLKKLMFRFHITGADTTNIFRVIIFRWSQNNALGANVPVTTDILQTANVMSFYNYTNEHDTKVRILYDKTITLSVTGDTEVDLIKGSLYGTRLGRKIIDFNAATTLGTNQIYMLMISDSAGIPHPSIKGYWRIEYTDS